MQRDFKGVWIPKEIWMTEDLGWTEKFLLTEIDSLSKNKECFATNEYFAKFFKISKDRVSKIISTLSNKGYVEVKLIYKPGTKQVEKRVITTIGYSRKQLEGIGENNHTPIGENTEDINTSFINPINNTSTTTTENPIIFYENNLGLLSPLQMQEIWEWVDDYNGQSEIIIESMKIALDRNKKNMGFVKFLLKDWKDKGAKTLSDVQALQTEWKGKGGKPFESTRGNFKGTKSESRNYDDEISRRQKERPSFIKSV